MARNETHFCDICKQETEQIVHKLFLSAAGRVHRDKAPHSNYTHHLDVGVCCAARLMKSFNWRKRMSAEEYRESRKRK